jgi:transposase
MEEHPIDASAIDATRYWGGAAGTAHGGTRLRAVIPPRKNRKQPREYDKDLYKLRHLVENSFLHLKRRRGIATRYAKNLSPFVIAIQIRCHALWVAISLRYYRRFNI